MELTDSLTVANLISNRETAGQAVVQRNTSPAHMRRGQCKCGSCTRCLDNARWERIFREKFEDPDYYRQPRSRVSGSSLA